MHLEWGFSKLISDNFAILTLANKIRISPWNGQDFLAKGRMPKFSEINCEKPHSKSINVSKSENIMQVYLSFQMA